MKTELKKWFMKYKTILFIGCFISVVFLSSFSFQSMKFKNPVLLKTIQERIIVKDSVKQDSIHEEGRFVFTLFKQNAHASYYADRFTGRRTASGEIFDNQKYTAAHKKLPFGTKVRVTNQANGKSVMVVVTDRGPFTKGKDIDLTKRAFRDIARNSSYGSMKVTIEIVSENPNFDSN
jgi:rare lipoprotein A